MTRYHPIVLVLGLALATTSKTSAGIINENPETPISLNRLDKLVADIVDPLGLYEPEWEPEPYRLLRPINEFGGTNNDNTADRSPTPDEKLDKTLHAKGRSFENDDDGKLPVQTNRATSSSGDCDQVTDGILKKGTGCPHKSRRIIGYVASWSKRSLSVAQASRFTNLIYSFARMDSDGSVHLVDATSSQSRERLREMQAARRALCARGHHLALSFAIGGWTNSQHFSSVLGDPLRRARFIDNIVALVGSEHDFDGVDIDWEYPGVGGATSGKKEDRENYVRLVRELRTRLPAGKLLSIAGAAGEEALRGFDVGQLIESVDWIGVMAYDFNGAWDSKWGAYVGPNAPLRHAAPPGYSGKLNAHWAITQYVCSQRNRTGSANKIVLGLPFYGRFWNKTKESSGKHAGQYPLFRTAEPNKEGKFGGEISYSLIEDAWFKRARAKKHWDEQSSTPWALNEQTSAVLTYDDARSIGAKIQYALENQLGGVMVWSVDQDDDEMSLSSQLSKMCTPNNNRNDRNSIKCNPLGGEERRWWTWANSPKNAGMCGRNAPLYGPGGYYAHCDPDDPGYACCSKSGYCGSGPDFCQCPGCIDYSKNPEKLVEEPVRPSQAVQWHIGFSDSLKPGQPRCGKQAPALNGREAICNPDDEHNYCCSPAGFCGAGKGFCECEGCKNFRNASRSSNTSDASGESASRPKEIRWHVGFGVVRPGEPRCGPGAPKVNGQVAICDPTDDSQHCCSSSGYCGSAREYCECKGCVDARKIQ